MANPETERYVVRTRKINLSAQIKNVWGTDYSRPDIGYVFSNGRQFDNTDRSESGIYKNPS